ncbi:MAG: hypothetical protein QOC66_1625 [Pseudonocardiales bacterium]|nr:hypothetical protein [Pseudonocardiales bacterium]
MCAAKTSSVTRTFAGTGPRAGVRRGGAADTAPVPMHASTVPDKQANARRGMAGSNTPIEASLSQCLARTADGLCVRARATRTGHPHPILRVFRSCVIQGSDPTTTTDGHAASEKPESPRHTQSSRDALS